MKFQSLPILDKFSIVLYGMIVGSKVTHRSSSIVWSFRSLYMEDRFSRRSQAASTLFKMIVCCPKALRWITSPNHIVSDDEKKRHREIAHGRTILLLSLAKCLP